MGLKINKPNNKTKTCTILNIKTYHRPDAGQTRTTDKSDRIYSELWLDRHGRKTD